MSEQPEQAPEEKPLPPTRYGFNPAKEGHLVIEMDLDRTDVKSAIMDLSDAALLVREYYRKAEQKRKAMERRIIRPGEFLNGVKRMLHRK